MLKAGYDHKGPAAVRYPRGSVPNGYDKGKLEPIKIGKAKIVRKGKDIAILAFGVIFDACKKAAEKFDATLVNMRFVKPLDENLLRELAKTHKYFITVEDNVVAGGAGSAVNEFAAENKLEIFIKNLGLPDKILGHGTREEVLAEAGLDEDNILNSIKSFIENK